MADWSRYIQIIVHHIDLCIKNGDDDKLTLSSLSEKLGYSEYYTSRKFRELSGMTLKAYIRGRKFAFAGKNLIDDKNCDILDIAAMYGFSSNESFSHAFRSAFGISPSEYRLSPFPPPLRTVLRPFDCYLTDSEHETSDSIKTYFVHIPAHRFLHIRNYESIGYYDFWEKQSHIKGLCYDAVCRILDGINGKLDEGRGHVIAYINDAAGRICSWGIPLAEAYGIRLASDYDGPVPDGFYLMDVCEGDYIVFEHGPFDIEKESVKVESEIENRMKAFDYDEYGFCLDFRPGQVFYFYYQPECFFRYVRPIVRKSRKDKPLLL